MMNTDVVIDNEYIHSHLCIPADQYISYGHHKSHAAGCFYQSSYKEALIFSFDGGGDDGEFNIYHAIRGEDMTRLAQLLNPTYNRDRKSTRLNSSH